MKFFDITEDQEADTARLLIKIPFELTKDFKKVFSGEYQYRKDLTAWSIPLEARARLQEWIDLTKKIEELSRTASKQHMTETEIERTKKAVQEIEAELTKTTTAKPGISLLRNMLSDSLKTLRERKEMLAIEEANLMTEKQQANVLRFEIEATLSPLIDLKSLLRHFDTLILLESSAGAAEAAEWREAQLHFIRARNTLQNAGIQLEAINYLAEYAGPVRKMPTTAWYKITKTKT